MGRSTLSNILQAACTTPWAITPEKLGDVRHFLALRAAGVELSEEERQKRVGEGRRGAPKSPTATRGVGAGKAITVIPIYGTIAHRAHTVEDISGPGGTSTEKLSVAFDAALRDGNVGSIVFDIDSPGGTIAGVPEFAAQVFAARGQKPIKAVANSMAASAAYWIGSAADELIVTPSGDVGSIGVYTMHVDISEALALEGISPTLISAGKYKVEGHPFGPLTDEARAALQASVDLAYEDFLAAVAAHRNTTAAKVRAGYGQGRVVDARQAVAEGLADRVATLDQVLEELGAPPHAGSGAFAQRPQRTTVIDVVAGAAGDAPRANAATPPAAALSPRSTPSTTSTLPAPKARSTPVPDENGAPDGGTTTQDVTAVLAADRQRAREIRELGAAHNVEAKTIEAAVDGGLTVEAFAAQTMRQGRQRSAQSPHIAVGQDRAGLAPWGSLGEQLAAVVAVGMGRPADPRLHGAATGGSATSGPDGAFMIHPTYAQELLDSAFETGQLASRCSETPIAEGSDGLEVTYLDDTNRTTGNRWGGVRVYRVAEAGTVEASKPQTETWQCRLLDMMGIAYMTERLLRDAPAMQSVFEEAFRDEFAFKFDDEIFAGDGVTQALGYTKAPCLVTVAKVAAQAADTIVAQNFIDMWARMPVRFRKNAAWFINQELEPQLQTMAIATGANSGELVYMPPGGISGAPYGTVFGKPVIPIEHASAPGDVGDVTFAALDQYKVIRQGGIDQAESIHVRFLYRERTFRWFTRVSGAPKPKESITPYKGAKKLSPFIALEAR